MERPRLTGLVVLVFMAGLLAACASETRVESDLGIKDSPKWVNEGTSTLTTKDGRLFHGVGSAPLLGDFSLQTSTADNRARAEIARILSSYMEIVSRDYIASGKAKDAGFSEQNVTQQIDNVSKLNMAGVRIIGHWRDTRNNVIYSIAELDMADVKKTVQTVQDMNPGWMGYFTREADTIFDRNAVRETK